MLKRVQQFETSVPRTYSRVILDRKPGFVMEDDVQKELEEARKAQRLNVPAKRIIDKIQHIPSEVEKLQRRWFWELLQNADKIALKRNEAKPSLQHYRKLFSGELPCLPKGGIR